MKIKELKELLANADDNDNLEIIDGQLTLIKDRPQDITERIKTFEDARQWCNRNGKSELVCDLDLVSDCFDGLNDENKRDILAYLKLRVITTALNEGWEPDYESSNVRWRVEYDTEENKFTLEADKFFATVSRRLTLKDYDLAIYAATQFADIYADYFGVQKGGKE